MGRMPYGLELALDRAPARALVRRVEVEPKRRLVLTQRVNATAAREARAPRTRPGAVRKRGFGTRRGRRSIAAPREQCSGHEARRERKIDLSEHALLLRRGVQPNCCGGAARQMPFAGLRELLVKSRVTRAVAAAQRAAGASIARRQRGARAKPCAPHTRRMESRPRNTG